MIAAQNPPRAVVIGAGVGGLTTATLLARDGCDVTVLEAQTYPGGCAGTFYHQGYRFDAGATVAGGFQPNGPHAIAAKRLDIDWPVRLHEPAWEVHLPDRVVPLFRDPSAVIERFPGTEPFWREQARIADVCWSMSAAGLPWPPSSAAELRRLIQTGLAHFPRDLELAPLAFSNAHQWLSRCGLAGDAAFVRFVDAQLLIAAQTTSRHANAVYSATALDLARQGVYHVRGGMGGIARTLADKFDSLGGNIIYRQRVTRVAVEAGRVTGVYSTHGRRGSKETFFPCDFLIANLTPTALDSLLGDDSSTEIAGKRGHGWGAFVLHVGVEAALLPSMPDHVQVIADMEGPLGEGRSVFMSLSPIWDDSRAPAGHRAITLSTHTAVEPWWALLRDSRGAYEAQKHAYAEKMLSVVEAALPGFRRSIRLQLSGTPVTYEFYTGRSQGMVGGFPQVSLLKARGPRTGIANMRIVGDSIFPGQSTAGVTLGALRVADDVRRSLPTTARHFLAQHATAEPRS